MVKGERSPSLTLAIRYSLSLGFGELSDDAEVALWTGIIGAQFNLPTQSILMEAYSVDLLHDPISHFVALGKHAWPIEVWILRA